jgi:hypothetical protein
MRTLIIGALAVTMAGCSNRMPPHANTASDANGVSCSETAAAQPVELVPVIYESHSAIVKIHADTAAKRKPPSPSRRLLSSSKTASPPAHKAAADSGSAHAGIADAHSGGGAVASPKPLTIQQQVEAATAVAERMAAPAVAAPPGEPDSRVALVMARPEINSIADLGGKTVAIDDRQVVSRNKVWIAMVAAGAARVQLSEGPTKPVDRLIGGEVAAAVLTLVSAEAANSFPDVAGYRIFRIPLALRAINTQQDKP